MEQRFIQQVTIDWSKISEYSYLRKIPALQFEERIKFHKNITFLLEKMGPGNYSFLTNSQD